MGYTTDRLVNDQAVGVGRSELTPLERKTAARNIRVSLLDEGGSLSQRDKRRPLKAPAIAGSPSFLKRSGEYEAPRSLREQNSDDCALVHLLQTTHQTTLLRRLSPWQTVCVLPVQSLLALYVPLHGV